MGFIVVSRLFIKNNEMIKTIKKTALFSDPIGQFSRADQPVLGNDGQRQDGKAAGYWQGWQKQHNNQMGRRRAGLIA